MNETTGSMENTRFRRRIGDQWRSVELGAVSVGSVVWVVECSTQSPLL